MKKDDTKDVVKPLSLLSLILSIVSLFVISGLLFIPVDHDTRQVLIGLDFVICSIFLLQLTTDLIRAADRLQFLKRHWIDYLASIPMIEPLRFARIFHILRVIWVIRSGRFLMRQLVTNRRETTLASILLLIVVLLTIGSSMMLSLESAAPNANIHTAGDAIWWALVTISTVGYGDHYPVTDGGKILAGVLIVCGVGLFGMTSGLVSSLLTSPSRIQEQRSANKERMLHELLAQQSEILRRIHQLEKDIAATKKQDA
ncbi:MULTISPECIES: potassium channel family protein [Vibrio]|uniref:Putative potassium channel n=1 Tax=Vibrio proteolyticus NBRC 13287 TaxID=1219065 RepID=U3A5I9_VIBPR|nr:MULTISPECIES: potassium channel family protein [Vibrio]NAW56752.1 ion transporter [Vibrio sp. V36_P2S2PM302]NAX21492.1 ion transporter [Vibrio sp. V39_P1S14PM300]NAX28169.1 ion transporter [Vibrio sp. V38_P2S17PM301]NAX29935.1 ion transporter [Vibrio sp. V37_P2S8PM304]GAD68965.1 putative potassium channel [Vibrio proteolyticus NBRC 13287]